MRLGIHVKEWVLCRCGAFGVHSAEMQSSEASGTSEGAPHPIDAGIRSSLT